MSAPSDQTSAEWELALLCAATAGRREARRGRIAALAKRVSWPRLTALLSANRLLPSLGPRLVPVSAGDEFTLALAAALTASRHQDALLQLSGARVIAALAAAGIPAAALKGPLLGEAIYGEPGRRQSSDVDLLVAPSDLTAAVAVARELGYAPPRDPVGRSGLPLLHFSLAHARGELPPLELHWRIHWYEHEFAQQRLLPPGPAAADWRPQPADELAALLLYYARDGFAGLRQAADLGAWWDRFGDRAPPRALAQTASRYPALAPALAAASAVAARTVALPPPHPSPSLTSRSRLAVRLGERAGGYPNREQLFAEIGLIDGLLTPPRGLRAFVRRQVAPSRQVIEANAETAGTTHMPSTAGFALRTLARYLLALGRLARHGHRGSEGTVAPEQS